MLFEAAKVDGANAWQTFRYITLPSLKPMTLFVIITSIISYLQAYVQILIMTEGGPGTATYLASYIIYDEAFVNTTSDMHLHCPLYCSLSQQYLPGYHSVFPEQKIKGGKHS